MEHSNSGSTSILNYEYNEAQKLFSIILKYTMNHIFSTSSHNARVGHRNRLNIFDIVKLFRIFRITLNELRSYHLWIKSQTRPTLIDEIIPKYHDSKWSKECEMDLSFGIDVNETKRPGFDFLPPLPSTFTFKFTPVIINHFN